jgi:glycerophosphoryl diester phosphodiesterase
MAVITFAHRGARTEAAENSLPAFRRALELGAGGLETDVWLAADGEVVCTHNATVRSGMRRYRVASSSSERLRALGVPRLADLYSELGADYELSVDLKEHRAGDALLDVARRHGVLERLWTCSPDLDVLERLRPEHRVRLVHSTRKRAISEPLERHAHRLAELGIDAINLHHTEWTAGLVSLFHRFGLRAFAWDTQEARHIRAMLQIGIDAVYCDRPDRMVAVVGEFETHE